MRRVIEAGRLGSLFGDVAKMAECISAARIARDVTVWLNMQNEMICSGADIAPELPAEYLLGTYGVGAHLTDIQEDLVAFRSERASNAMLF